MCAPCVWAPAQAPAALLLHSPKSIDRRVKAETLGALPEAALHESRLCGKAGCFKSVHIVSPNHPARTRPLRPCSCTDSGLHGTRHRGSLTGLPCGLRGHSPHTLAWCFYLWAAAQVQMQRAPPPTTTAYAFQSLFNSWATTSYERVHAACSMAPPSTHTRSDLSHIFRSVSGHLYPLALHCCDIANRSVGEPTTRHMCSYMQRAQMCTARRPTAAQHSPARDTCQQSAVTSQVEILLSAPHSLPYSARLYSRGRARASAEHERRQSEGSRRATLPLSARCTSSNHRRSRGRRARSGPPPRHRR